MTNQPPTIKGIERKFNKKIENELAFPIKPFYRHQINDILEYLEMEETELVQNEKGSFGDGWNDAVKKLNKKIKRVRR